jgi:hypothetical protein
MNVSAIINTTHSTAFGAWPILTGRAGLLACVSCSRANAALATSHSGMQAVRQPAIILIALQWPADIQAWAWYSCVHVIMFNYFQADPRSWASRCVVLVYGFLVLIMINLAIHSQQRHTHDHDTPHQQDQGCA